MARWNHHQAQRSIYNRGQGDEAAPPMPISSRPGPRGGRASGPRPQRPSRPTSWRTAESGLPGVMGRAGEPGLRGRDGRLLRDPLRHYLEADRPPALRGAHPSGLWPLDLPPPVRWPPAGPRRRLPYLRSPGPPFYFLKPSHKAPRWPPLACFLPETLARAHFPSRLRARRAARACAPSPARSRALYCCHRQDLFGALACALTAPASFSRRSRGRGQGGAHAQCPTRASRARGKYTRSVRERGWRWV